MPELPEVETVRAHLAPELRGRRLSELEVLDPRWSEAGLAQALLGRTLLELSRRGKYLVFELSGEAYLLMHLRMTGTLLLDAREIPAHTRVRARFGSRELLFVDPRRFGTGELVVGIDALNGFFAKRLGVEPLEHEFTAAHLRARARGRRGPVKSFLLDQHHVAGVGNIYADEALFRAKIHPLRAAGALRPGQYALLRDAVVAALLAGIDAGGASIDDFRDPYGARGSFQNEFLVHRRAGLPCPACATAIRKMVIGGRATYACERCQPRPRTRRPAQAPPT